MPPRDPRVDRAVRLVQKKGLNASEAARRVGVSSSAVRKRLNPERTRAYYRFDAQRRRATKREWDRQNADPCIDCGGSVSQYRATRCIDCARDHRAREYAARIDLMIALRAQGLLNDEIAAVIGSTKSYVATTFNRARREGFDVPPSPYHADRIRFTRGAA